MDRSYCICFIVLLSISTNSYSQVGLKNYELSIGYGIAEQDRRLFEFAKQQTVLDHETSKNDHQFEILLIKPIFNADGNISMFAGMGYSLFTTKFSRPFDPNYFPNERSSVLRYISRYSIHNIKILSTINFNIINTNHCHFSILFPFNLNININKNVKAGGNIWHKNKWNFKFYNFEIYSGLKYEIKRFNFSVNYRFFNYQEIDKVIFNQVLFKVTNQTPELLTKDAEINNLGKLLFNISYKLKP